ncbi:MAG: hypothetical protein VKP62_06940, partial [Candidatus Sericytochromatia bacterium]|nr:hypothetical protein [Candidatus Sericytochromatia bacterium]
MRLVALSALCLSCVASLACSIQLVSPPLPAGPNTAASTQPATAAGVAGPTVQSPETTVTLSGVVRVPADYTGMGAGAARLRLLQTPIIDTNNRTIIDTNNKTIIDTNNKTIIDTNNKTIIDTNNKTIIDTNNKTI